MTEGKKRAERGEKREQEIASQDSQASQAVKRAGKNDLPLLFSPDPRPAAHHRPPDLTGNGEYLVPDVLQEGLTLVLVGTAPSRISAARRAYYANPMNKFWRTLADVGLTPRQLAPHEYPRLPGFGIGLTDVAKRHSGVDAALPGEAWCPEELRAKVALYRPPLLAFTSKRGASETLGVSTGKLPYGRQSQALEGAEVWVLPSTSPLGHNHFQLAPWQALAHRFHDLRDGQGAG